ncbi:hypothetical protein A3I35_01890 [Candidatus Falkowbacteria bacterium RIFCSPLOWO2_02_FULL_45_15]|uniref:N-acetyltransferase domain-containing protein n=3 Tax=Candidatus Falkowiibacteriota TaxID=1752728 RepID=A0A1F5RYR5_9BACT|nr:MAG: hypothetical protein A3I35_01890 [Candidatus Falkowbacteria bacterium RIFCSPLOWO2_02_FULL_45_15]
MTKVKNKFIISGPRLSLRALSPADASNQYLHWMNDQCIQRYTRRRDRRMTMKDLKSFLINFSKSEDKHLAIIITKENKHIGNIFIIFLDKPSKYGELTIMIGDSDEWGKGYAQEAIALAADFSFKQLDLYRLEANSSNPAFNRLIKKLGWTFEGYARQAFLEKNKFYDVWRWSILKPEWQKLRQQHFSKK